VARPLALSSFKPREKAVSCRKKCALIGGRQNWLQPRESIMVRVPNMRHSGFFFFSRPTGLLQRSENVV